MKASNKLHLNKRRKNKSYKKRIKFKRVKFIKFSYDDSVINDFRHKKVLITAFLCNKSGIPYTVPYTV